MKSVTITTETRGGLLMRAVAGGLGSLLIGLLVFLALHRVLDVTGRGPAGAIAAVVALGAGVVAVPPILDRLDARGTWIVDGDGIAFEPVHGRRAEMRWADVERVRWTATSIHLEGETDLRVGSGLLGLSQWIELRDAIAVGLATPAGGEAVTSPRMARLMQLVNVLAPALVLTAVAGALGWVLCVLVGSFSTWRLIRNVRQSSTTDQSDPERRIGRYNVSRSTGRKPASRMARSRSQTVVS